MALPLSGLVLFFEMTQPAKVMSAGAVVTQVASAPVDLIGESGARTSPLRAHATVARFDGVSAQQNNPEPAAQVLTASEARHVFSRAPFGSLKPGLQVEFLSKDRHRISLLIVSREPVVDRAMQDNARLMSVTEASTANFVTFAWGDWIYKAEMEDKGVEPEVVVPKLL